MQDKKVLKEEGGKLGIVRGFLRDQAKVVSKKRRYEYWTQKGVKGIQTRNKRSKDVVKEGCANFTDDL